MFDLIIIAREKFWQLDKYGYFSFLFIECVYRVNVKINVDLFYCVKSNLCFIQSLMNQVILRRCSHKRHLSISPLTLIFHYFYFQVRNLMLLLLNLQHSVRSHLLHGKTIFCRIPGSSSIIY